MADSLLALWGVLRRHLPQLPFLSKASMSADQCGRLLVGQGDDTYDPNCVLAAGHSGQCQPGNQPDRKKFLLTVEFSAAPVQIEVEGDSIQDVWARRRELATQAACEPVKFILNAASVESV